MFLTYIMETNRINLQFQKAFYVKAKDMTKQVLLGNISYNGLLINNLNSVLSQKNTTYD